MSTTPEPHWSSWVTATAFVLAVVACAAGFIYALGIGLRFMSSFL